MKSCDAKGTFKMRCGRAGFAAEVHPTFQRYRRIVQYNPEPTRRLAVDPKISYLKMIFGDGAQLQG